MRSVATRRYVLIVGLVGMLLGTILGAAIMAASPAGAGNGDPLLVGKKTNATRTTKLIGRHGLEIRASRSEALKLYTQPGVAPMRVNQGAKVDNLNADKLDNWHIHSIAPRIATAGPAVPTNGASPSNICSGATSCNVLTTTIETPADGILLMGGYLDLERYSNSEDNLLCGFRVNGASLTAGGFVQIQVGRNTASAGTQTYNQEDDCSLTSTKFVSQGSHTVALRVESIRDDDTDIGGGGGSLWVAWFPIDGSTGSFLDPTADQ